MSMEFTGERFVPGCGIDITFEHYHRYVFLKDLVRGKKALDLACGEGYGSSMLAEWAEEVVGVDISKDAVDQAKEKYKKDNLEYEVQDCRKVGDALSGDYFDVVAFFEAIEHISGEDQREALKNIKKVLKRDGILVVSTPNKGLVAKIGNPKNEFHLCEMELSEFRELLCNYFKNVVLFAQRFETASLVWPLGRAHNVQTTWNLMDKNGRLSRPHMPGEGQGLFYIAVCSDGRQVEEAMSSILLDENLDIFSTSSRDLNNKVAALERHIAEIYQSNSWRVTAPLRWLTRKLR